MGGPDAFLAATNTEDCADVARDVMDSLNELARGQQAQVDELSQIDRDEDDVVSFVETMPHAGALHALADFLWEAATEGDKALDAMANGNENLQLYPNVVACKTATYGEDCFEAQQMAKVVQKSRKKEKRNAKKEKKLTMQMDEEKY